VSVTGHLLTGKRLSAGETFQAVNHFTPGNRTAGPPLFPGMTTTTPAAITHRYLTANGVRLHVAEAGASGPPVLLLHGYPQHWYAWRHVITGLAAGHRVYALDLRGAGQSDAPRRGYDSATLTADVLAALDALGLSAVTLAGHEWGGWLGFHLALAAPHRFTGFVAVNAPHPWLPHRKLLPQMWRLWHTALLEYPLLGGWAIRRTGVLRWLLRRGRPGLPAAEVEVFAGPAREPARARAGQQLHWQAVLRDIPRRAFGGYRHRHLSVPALLLAGAKDFALTPRSLTGAGTHADDLAVRVIADAGHYLPEEQPGIVAAAIGGMARR
jgi:pimeloyl-ACP methyl ester carboxylesterase